MKSGLVGAVAYSQQVAPQVEAAEKSPCDCLEELFDTSPRHAVTCCSDF